ncbi:hypothetical protein B0H14DRAFT_2837697 [Mycena olivaceomarginata]|nr:hypothetical protein B0H14DRAFT_2837697 [Mycena olivaceomarginata]
MPLSVAKYASLFVTLAGGLVNSLLTLQLASSWNTLQALDAESELDAWKLDGLRVLWALLAWYLLAAAFVSFVGFFGVLRNKPAHVRLYRDCASADLAFTLFATLLAFLAARAPARAACEQPELAPLLVSLSAYLSTFYTSAGPDEACERALEHTALVALAALVVLSVVRLHFLLAVSTHYASMSSALAPSGRPSHIEAEAGGVTVAADGEQRIRLLPLPAGVARADVVYAPVHCPAAGRASWARVRRCGCVRGAGSSSAYQPAYVNSAPASPAVPPYAPAYVQATPAPQRDGEEEVELDAGLLDARVVRVKREWI